MKPALSLSMLAEMRRGLKALNSVFGNKIAILAGDFLLARASVSLAALRDSEVIQLLSQVIEDLVTGEILQVCTYDCCNSFKNTRHNIKLGDLLLHVIEALVTAEIILRKPEKVLHILSLQQLSWSLRLEGVGDALSNLCRPSGIGLAFWQSVAMHLCKEG